jgi:signal recognition particle receptor subunit beta
LLFVAVIFVIDSSNKDRLMEAQNELAKLVQEKELREASLLIFVNKQVFIMYNQEIYLGST